MNSYEYMELSPCIFFTIEILLKSDIIDRYIFLHFIANFWRKVNND